MKVSLVGAGPGDPGLLTLKGKKALEEADAIVYDALANPSLLNFAKAGAELIYVGKIAGKHALPQDQINELLAKKARENGGKNVARLKGGDPYIFGRGGEEAEYLQTRGIPFEEIPGISSAIAAPAYAGIPLTHRGFTSSLTIVTGHENPEKGASSHNWRALAESGSTLVFVMGVKNLAFIAENLVQHGMDPKTPAAIIYMGTTPMQRSLIADLGTLPEAAHREKFSNPSVIVIGNVVKMHEKLDWFSSRPLLGRTIAVTRAREQASGMARTLAELGANVLECPSIEIRPLENYGEVDEAISHLGNYAWLILTSVNGVKYFWRQLEKAGLDSRALGHAKIAAIGPATAEALAMRGIRADLVPATYVAEAVVQELLAAENIAGKKVLIPRAAVARMVLPDELARAGATVDVAPVYEAVPGKGCAAEIKRLLAGNTLDCLTFGSSSTVRNFFDLVPAQMVRENPKAKTAVIGPVTAKTLREYGIEPAIMPASHTIPGLVAAILACFANKK